MKYEENAKVELKRELIDDLVKEIIAFLNTKGGTIFIGVENDGTIVGVPNHLKDIYDEKISNILTDKIKPNCRSLVSFSYNEDNVLEIIIKEGEAKPYYLSSKGPKPSGTYIRIGRSKRPADLDEIITMIRDSSGRLYEDQISPIQDLTFDDFNNVAKKKKLKLDKTKYQNLKILDKDDKYTNLGLLVSDQNNIEVKFAVYDINMNFKVKKEFNGSIIKIIQMVLEYADLYNETSAKIIPGRISRVEKRSYPEVSLREGILNAICHADYSAPSNIKIEFYIDKVKITNPGNIYNNGTIEDIKRGVQSFRNPSLVLLLNKLGYIENYGSGIERILKSYEKEIKQPEFYVSKKYFILTLYNNNYFENNGNDKNSKDKDNEFEHLKEHLNEHLDFDFKLSKDEKENIIIELVKSDPYITYEEISSRLHISVMSTRRLFNSLKEKGIILNNRTNRHEPWILKE